MRSQTAASLLVAAALALSGPLSALAQDSGKALGPKEMPGFCRDAAINQFGAQPKSVKVRKVVEGKDGFTVPGTVDHSADSKTKFSCTFDTAGKFVQLLAEAREE